MRLTLVSLFTVLSLGLTSAAQAADDKPPLQVESWPLQQTGVIGWIVVEQGDAQLVTFLRGAVVAGSEHPALIGYAVGVATLLLTLALFFMLARWAFSASGR